MPGQLQGTVGEFTNDVNILPDNSRLRVAYDHKIDYLNVEKTMLFHAMSKIKKVSTDRMEFFWQTQERKKDFVTLAGTAVWSASTNGTFTVSAADKFLFAEGDIIMFPTVDITQNIYVNSVDQATGIVTAQTQEGGTITIADTNVCVLIGNSFESGSGVGTIKSEQPTPDSNYIQIMQTPIGVTKTAQHLAYTSGPELDKQRFEAGVDHGFKIEKSLFFGRKGRKSSGLMDGVYEQWWMGGLNEKITTNVTDASGALTQEEFSDWLISATKYSKTPFIFSSELIYEALTTWAQTKLEIQSQSENSLGMSITKYMTPYGDSVMLKPHRELLINELNEFAFCVDMSDVEYRYLNGLDTHVESDVQLPGVKQKIDEFRTWFSMKVGNERRHGILNGVTSITP